MMAGGSLPALRKEHYPMNENAVSARSYRCTVCDHIYDPAVGDPESGIPPGTPFERLPETWCCPECGAAKGDFEPVD
jgi:rubredoxin